MFSIRPNNSRRTEVRQVREIDTIDAARRRIQDREDIPEDEQRLVFPAAIADTAPRPFLPIPEAEPEADLAEAAPDVEAEVAEPEPAVALPVPEEAPMPSGEERLRRLLESRARQAAADEQPALPPEAEVDEPEVAPVDLHAEARQRAALAAIARQTAAEAGPAAAVEPAPPAANPLGLPAADFANVRAHQAPPARALQARAFTRGANIHLGPEQERQLPHEAWHVVQQRQGRGRPPEDGPFRLRGG